MTTQEEIYLEHYKIMRQEILQNSSEGLKIFQMAIVIFSSLFAVALSEVFQPQERCFMLLVLPVIIAPMVMLIAQRFRQTRKIGYHIRLKIEPKLNLEWENDHCDEIEHGKQRITPRALRSISMPLFGLQFTSLVLSFYYLYKFIPNAHGKISPPELWYLVWGIGCILVVYLINRERLIINKALSETFTESKGMKATTVSIET